ncbi:MAG: hypothetical protein ACJASQ_002806 [Crocinitomicaceae bacterium]|jgi:hypothetical protein
MKLSTLFLILGLASITACNKGKADFTLKGTITDNTSGTALEGGTVQLYEIEAGTLSTSLIGESTIGADGSYSFTFPRNTVESYTLSIRKENYFDQDKTIPFSDLTLEEDNVKDYSTTAMSWARLRFITTDPMAEMHYVKQLGKQGCATCCSTDEQVLNGVQDYEIICPNDGNTVYSYNYWIIGTPGVSNKSATTNAFDTTTITLNY